MSPRRLVVIAHYREKLDWVPWLSVDYVIFHKGDWDDGAFERAGVDPVRVTRVPNVGREAETYLRFLSQHSDRCCSEYASVAFCQGSPFEHVDRAVVGRERGGMGTERGTVQDVVAFLNAFPETESFTALGRWYECANDGRPWMSMPQLPAMVRQLCRDPETLLARDSLWFVQGAQMIVPTSKIRQRPVGFWARLHEMSLGDHDAFYLFAHVMERLWYYVFEFGISAEMISVSF
jgi:hypothetical protein